MIEALLPQGYTISKKDIAGSPEATMPFINHLARQFDFDVNQEWKVFILGENSVKREKKRSIYEITEGYFQEIFNILRIHKHKIISKTREREVLMARYMFVYICVQNNVGTLKEIGKIINRDRTTCNHTLKEVNNLIEYNDVYFMPVYNSLKPLIFNN